MILPGGVGRFLERRSLVLALGLIAIATIRFTIDHSAILRVASNLTQLLTNPPFEMVASSLLQVISFDAVKRR